MSRDVSIVLVLFVAILAGASVYFITQTDSGDNIEGHWYVIDCYGYIDGEYVSLGDNDGIRDLDVTRCESGVFYGNYRGDDYVGSFNNGEFMSYGTYDGVKAYLNGKVIGDLLYVSLVEQGDKSGDAVLYLVYSKDPNASYSISDNPDVTGAWEAYDNYYINTKGEKNLLEGKYLNVDGQQQNVFYGKMEQLVYGDVVELPIFGVMGYSKDTDHYYGSILVAGEIWTLYTEDGSFIMRTTMANDTGIELGTASVNRTYSRDGKPVDEPTIDLLGQWSAQWAASAYKGPANAVIITSDDVVFDITVTIQYGPMFCGEVTYLETKHSVVGYIIGDYIEMEIIYGGDLEFHSHCRGYFTSDGCMHINEWYSYLENVNADYTILKRDA